MNRSLRIALIAPPMSWYDRTLIDGITAYAQEHGPWRFVLQADTSRNQVEPWLRRWKPDGVLARITAPQMARQLRDMGVPVVDLLEESGRSLIPRIVCDDHEAVRRAVDHLLDRHLRHLAYVGRRDTQFSRLRRECFRDYVKAKHRGMRGAGDGQKLTCADILLPWDSMPHLRMELAGWLRALPKPVGIVACNDAWGTQVLRACSEFGFRVPDEVAVIGIDDDPVICRMNTPSLSSVGVNARVIGYRAAAMLHGMIVRGESPPPITFVEPGSVQARESTDTLAIADPEVVVAIRYLRAHACEHMTPDLAAANLGVSRRTLERMFAQHVGHTPATEISNARLERVRELLIVSGLPLAHIAHRTGFFHVETLQRLFKKRFRIAPGAYRRAHGPARRR
jgi:LacI family transcriptional regulator